MLPLTGAVFKKHHDVVVWLLSHGADPNGDKVMRFGAIFSTAAILQLLIDAGGDVNGNGGRPQPLFSAILYLEGNAQLLLAQPCLDLGDTPKLYALVFRSPLADVIAQEVSGKGFPFCS